MIRILGLCVVCFAVIPGVFADEVDTIEDFALAADRDVALRRLIPGTEDYYYFHCLHLQNTRQLDEVEPLITAWTERRGDSKRLREIRCRQALLTYPQGRRETLDTLARELGLHFDHQRETRGAESGLPTTLDPRLIDRQELRRRALSRHDDLAGFERRALGGLVHAPLTSVQRRQLLERLDRPDHAGLARLVVEDLRDRARGGFGSLSIHEKLLLSQLDECLTLLPRLIENASFVDVYLGKLRGSDDVDTTQDRAARREWLERMWSFVQRLSPVFNSLRVHVLYHLLVLDESEDRLERDRFLAYLALPRPADYIDADLYALAQRQGRVGQFAVDFPKATGLPAVSSWNDRRLVTDLLEHFFRAGETTDPFEPFIDDTWLQQLHAETKILAGEGDPERWAAILTPDRFEELEQRVDLRFEPTNRARFGAEDPVSLDLRIKNVSTLIVKVFEINAQSYYRSELREVGPYLDLDGLVPNEELSFTYEDLPLRSFLRHFELPSLDGPGVYVVDFIGNGQSSRALIRKGELETITEIGPAGQSFWVFDERHRPVADPRLWIAGREYTADQSGRVLVPFMAKRAERPMVITAGELSVLDTFWHAEEHYTLRAGIHVDRESLIEGKRALLMVRPMLTLAGTPVSLSLLEDVRLSITSKTLDGLVASRDVPDFALHEDRESVYELAVPPRLAELRVELHARIQVASRKEARELEAGETFFLNGIDSTEHIESILLGADDAGYFIDVLGKNGEPRPHRPVRLTLKHRDFTEPVEVLLQSNAVGRIELGSLEDIETVETGELATSQSWSLLGDAQTYPELLNGRAGEILEIPYPVSEPTPSRATFSLLEKRDHSPVRDCFDALSIEDGVLMVRGLPAGNYDLLLKEPQKRVSIWIAKGPEQRGWVLGEHRQLELRDQRPLQILSAEASSDGLVVRLRNSDRLTRVHVFADRFHPRYRHDRGLWRGGIWPNSKQHRFSESVFLEGLEIDDEYRYILERRLAKKYPGNMLERPSLLLNPWPTQPTDETEQEGSGDGQQYRGPGDSVPPDRATPGAAPSRQPKRYWTANLDFLGEGAVVLLNLRPDDSGELRIPRSQLGAHGVVHVVAVAPLATVYRRVTLPRTEMPRRDRRLAASLDLEQHFGEEKKITVLGKDEELVVRDVARSTVEAYDSLESVFRFYGAWTRNPTLARFAFILDWPSLDAEQKHALYSEHACHELHYFLFKKDPEFFESVIRPFLSSKKDKTFLDDWLVGNDLSRYVRPWQYAQLNAFERILLSQHMPDRGDDTLREMSDLTSLLPQDAAREDALFQTALLRDALGGQDAFGAAEAKRRAREEDWRKLEESERRSGGSERAKQDSDFEDAPDVADDDWDADSEDTLEEAWEDEAELSLERELRDEMRRLYLQTVDTREWAESNYYRVSIDETTPDLIRANAFWTDFARHDDETPFFSRHFTEATSNFTEMILALAVLDLPFAAGAHESVIEGGTLRLKAATPLILFHQEIEPVERDVRDGSLLLSESLYRQVGGEKIAGGVGEELLAGEVYGMQVVLTNPTSEARGLKVLLQIPQGSMPVAGGAETRNVDVALEPYRTQTIDTFFYFPRSGRFSHYPVQVSSEIGLLAAGEQRALVVVGELQNADPESWDILSQNGSPEDVLAYLEDANLYRIDLSKIAFRMRDPGFFEQAIALLTRRHVYDQTLWSYGVLHDHVPAIRELLQFRDDFVEQCGPALDSTLLRIDPVERRTYQHLDYRPLINARAHRLGRRHEILNGRFYDQYHRLLGILSCRSELQDSDRMAVVYYLLLQDRIEAALGQFGKVDPDQLETKLQYDYCAAYLDFYTPELEIARKIVARYREYPIDHWRKAFASIGAQLAEIDGAATWTVNQDDPLASQTLLASRSPMIDFSVEGSTISIEHRNVEALDIAYYLMDIELLFSRSPFVQGLSGHFSHIRPNRVDRIELSDDSARHDLSLPAGLQNENLLIEISGAGLTRSQAFFSSSLRIELSETYGQLRVLDESTADVLDTVYVKVYARLKDGSVELYKDGYTDRRGRFDYASLSTDTLDSVDRFAILILSETHGSTIREAAPPAR